MRANADDSDDARAVAFAGDIIVGDPTKGSRVFCVSCSCAWRVVIDVVVGLLLLVVGASGGIRSIKSCVVVVSSSAEGPAFSTEPRGRSDGFDDAT